MIGFRDMSFCSAFPSQCANKDCPRAVTGQVREAARQWWGGDDYPIVMTDFFEPCNIKIPVVESTEEFTDD